MRELKKLFIKIMHPPVVCVFLLTLFSMAALIFTFMTSRDTAFFGYISYLLSAYTLSVLIINIPEILKKMRLFIHESIIGIRLKQLLFGNKYIRRYITDISFRIEVSLFLSLFINIIYAAFKLISGIYYASFWYGADAIYYIVLSMARVMLARYIKRGKHGLINEYRVYRLCGILLFVLNAALSGVVFQIIHQNMGYSYPGLLIYAVAIFAFINIITAVVNLVKYRKFNSPVLSAVKVFSLAKALVAMFALQSAMFASFGDGNALLERIMNSVIGGLVCFIIFTMATIMVLTANSKLKKFVGNSGVNS